VNLSQLIGLMLLPEKKNQQYPEIKVKEAVLFTAYFASVSAAYYFSAILYKKN
jgi:hypothetical protein